MSNYPSDDSLEQVIYDLRNEIRDLEEKIKEAAEKAAQFAEERDRIHNKMKEIKQKVQSLKQERVAINESIKELRRTTRELRQKLLNHVLETKALRGELKGLKLPSDVNTIKKRLDEIDLYLASHRVKREEERRLFEEASRLEALLLEYEKALRIHEHLTGLSPAIEALKKELDEKRALLEEMQKKQAEITRQMDNLNNEYNEYKKQADELHAKFLEMRENKDRLEVQQILAMSKLYEIQKRLRGSREELAKRKISEIKEKKKKEVMAKLSKGEKIEFEELKILLEDNPDLFKS